MVVAGQRQKRCLVTMGNNEESPVLPYQFLVNLDHNRVGVMVGGILVSTATQRIVNLPGDRKVHVLGGQGWSVLAMVENLEVGTRLVMINLLNNRVSLVPFDQNGLAMRVEREPRMRLNEDRPHVIRQDEKDDRLEHECDWDDHDDKHDSEDRFFYSALLAYFVDRKRLTIPAGFVRDYNIKRFHNALLRYESTLFYVDVDVEPHSDRANHNDHMTFNTNWRNVSEECDFEPNKLVRFTMIFDDVPDILQTIDVRHPVKIPLFDIC